MKTFIADIIPKLSRYSQKLDNNTLLTNWHWILFDENTNSKTVYIFRPNYELLISQNGKVEKAKWEYLGHNSLLIDMKEESYLFKQGFFDENILALKVDSKDEYAFFINEIKFEGHFKTIQGITKFLELNYFDEKNQSKQQPELSPLNSEEKEENEIGGWIFMILLLVIIIWWVAYQNS